MPLLTPEQNETKEEFTKRFMDDEKMKNEFPDEKQRYAICESQWSTIKADKGLNEMFIFSLEKGEIKPNKKEQWILVFPRGKYFFEKYNKEINFNDSFFDKISAAYDSQELSKPYIDKDHEFSESYGDLTEYKVDDSGMWFKVELNSKGTEVIKDRQYKYISPAWGGAVDTKQNKYECKLMAVSLTNTPAFEGVIPELMAQMSLSKIHIIQKNKSEGKDMELIALAKELSIAEDSTIEAVMLSVKNLKCSIDKLEAEKVELNKKLSETEEKALSLSKEISEIKRVELEKEAKSFVGEMIKLGKIHPAVQDIVMTRYMADKEMTVTEMSLIPEKQFEQKTSPITELEKDFTEKMVKLGLDPKSEEDVKMFRANYKPAKI